MTQTRLDEIKAQAKLLARCQFKRGSNLEWAVNTIRELTDAVQSDARQRRDAIHDLEDLIDRLQTKLVRLRLNFNFST